MRQLFYTVLVLASFGSAACGDVSANNTPDAPSVSSVLTAFTEANPYGLVPGLTWNEVTSPECEAPITGGSLTYRIYSAPDWIEIDRETRVISVNAPGIIPEDEDLVDELDYTWISCDSTIPVVGQDDDTSFFINDLNSNGTIDALEHGTAYVPLVNNGSYIELTESNLPLYRGIHDIDDDNEKNDAYRQPSGMQFSSVFPYLFGTTTAIGLDDDDDEADNASDDNPFVPSSDGEFAAQVTYTSLSTPDAILTADFNGDGDLDLAVTAPADDKASVFLGDGDGTFAARTDYSVGDTPWGMTAADFDMDGDIDLATANNVANTVSILFNDGEGIFTLGSSPSVGDGPIDIIAADFDGDGDMDLAAGNANDISSGSISILLNDGDGTFTGATAVTTGVFPNHLTAADFDADGNMDIAVTIRGSNGDATNFSVFLGDGDGTFADAANYTTNDGPAGIATGDLDGDGDLDIAVANNRRDDGSTVSIFLGAGDGTFGAKTDVNVALGPYEIAILDVEGDGDLDLAVTDFIGKLRIFTNDGEASFTAGEVLSTSSNSGNPYVTAGDFDGDYDLDLAVSNFSGASVGVFLAE